MDANKGFPPEENPPMLKVPMRVEWENNGVDIYIDDDDEALLMTAQEAVRLNKRG